MVNPLTPASSASIPANPVSLEIERPPLPEPAREVTPAAETIGAGNSASRQAGPEESTAKPLEQALEDVNNTLKAWSTGMRFDIDPDAQRVVVSIVDSVSGEVLRTVPSDAVIKIAKMIVQLQGQSISTSA